MGLTDKAKGLLDGGADKAKDAVVQHEDKIVAGIDKAAGVADSTTKGKYSDKIGTGADKAKDAVSKVAETHKAKTAAKAPPEGGAVVEQPPTDPPAAPPA
jgi:hypothetical protein